MVAAQNSAEPAVLGISNGQLLGVTQNRRARINAGGKGPLSASTIDPNIAVIRVDSYSN